MDAYASEMLRKMFARVVLNAQAQADVRGRSVSTFVCCAQRETSSFLAFSSATLNCRHCL